MTGGWNREGMDCDCAGELFQTTWSLMLCLSLLKNLHLVKCVFSVQCCSCYSMGKKVGLPPRHPLKMTAQRQSEVRRPPVQPHCQQQRNYE